MKEMTRTANRTATINHGKNEHSAQQIEQTVPTAPTTPTASTTSTASTAPTVINTKGGSGGIVTDSPPLIINQHPSCRAYSPIRNKSLQPDVHMVFIDFISDRRQLQSR